MSGSESMFFGPGGGLRFAQDSSRALGTSGMGSVRYPSPFFDIAQLYLPASTKALLKWCRYYFLTNPLINAAIYKMAEYPVTDMVYDTTNIPLMKKWKTLFDGVLHFKKFLVESGLDYGTYGNAFISIFYPFLKHLKCKKCGRMTDVRKQNYIFRSFEFVGECQFCKHHGAFSVVDIHVRSMRDIRLIRWNPEYITIQHNDATGESEYYYSIPPVLANDARMGKKNIIEKLPQIFIQALKDNKSLKFGRDNLFHMKRPTIAQKDRGWGLPIALPVLKDAFYLQILRKAQECVSPDTLVETIGGLVPANDVNVGDIVRTHTGEFHRINEKWYRDAKEDEMGVKLTVTGLRALPSVYSPLHPVFTIRRSADSRRSDTKDRQRSSVILRNPHLYEEAVCPAAHFQIGDYVLYPKNLPESEQVIDTAKVSGLLATDNYTYSSVSLDTAKAFETLEAGDSVRHNNAGRAATRAMKDGRSPKRLRRYLPVTEDLAYVLGWYAGDGSRGSRHVTFSIGADNPPSYAENLSNAIKAVFGVSCTSATCFNVRPLVASCVIMNKVIGGLVPGHARTKKIPEAILHATKSVKLAFLRGLFEADGYIGKDVAALCISSRDLSYDVYRVLLSLGCISTVSYTKGATSQLADGREIRGNGNYPLEVHGASKERLLSLWRTGKGSEVVSGKSGFFWKDYFATRVCAVEEVEEDTYIDFKIDKDTTFCTPGTATKNSIAVEHTVPLRVLFPQSGSASSDVYSSVNLSQWRNKIEKELLRWRLDNNYIPIMPIPIGHETLGGETRALSLSQEYRVWAEHIVAGLGIPSEFVFGGLSFSGSSVSMRMLENHFLNDRSNHRRLAEDFIMPNVGAFMGWEPIPVYFKKFKMADDLQRGVFNLQLTQAGKISDRALLEDLDWDSSAEAIRISEEQVRDAERQRSQMLRQVSMQGEAQILSTQYQARAQKVMMEAQGQVPQGPSLQGEHLIGSGEGQDGASVLSEASSPLTTENAQPGMDMSQVADQIAGYLDQMPEVDRQPYLAQLGRSNPELSSFVQQMLTQRRGAHKSSGSKPLPEVKAPRRGADSALV